jgi:hypothetical protein
LCCHSTRSWLHPLYEFSGWHLWNTDCDHNSSSQRIANAGTANDTKPRWDRLIDDIKGVYQCAQLNLMVFEANSAFWDWVTTWDNIYAERYADIAL